MESAWRTSLAVRYYCGRRSRASSSYMHSIIRWRTVSSPMPYGHIGMVAVGILTLKRKAYRLIFPVYACMSMELSAFFRPIYSLYCSRPSLGLGKSAAGVSWSHRYWIASSSDRLRQSQMTTLSGEPIPIHYIAYLDLYSPSVATGLALFRFRVHSCACILSVHLKNASVSLQYHCSS